MFENLYEIKLIYPFITTATIIAHIDLGEIWVPLFKGPDPVGKIYLMKNKK